MIRKLTKHGNDLALVFDQALLDQLQIDEKTPLVVTTDGKCVCVVPLEESEFGKAVIETSDQYRHVFKRLAE
jgi:hypothetical protein